MRKSIVFGNQIARHFYISLYQHPCKWVGPTPKEELRKKKQRSNGLFSSNLKGSYIYSSESIVSTLKNRDAKYEKQEFMENHQRFTMLYLLIAHFVFAANAFFNHYIQITNDIFR